MLTLGISFLLADLRPDALCMLCADWLRPSPSSVSHELLTICLCHACLPAISDCWWIFSNGKSVWFPLIDGILKRKLDVIKWWRRILYQKFAAYSVKISCSYFIIYIMKLVPSHKGAWLMPASNSRKFAAGFFVVLLWSSLRLIFEDVLYKLQLQDLFSSNIVKEQCAKDMVSVDLYLKIALLR